MPDESSAPTVAALYVQTGGVYYGLNDVDPWDETRDARLYDGPYPVVAHPPCTAWCMLSYCRPEIVRGEDGGCFEAALAAVRRYGGILEHPRYSEAWSVYGLPQPSRYGWTQALFDRGYATEIDQGSYGHPCHKPTWIYYVGPEPPSLIWGRSDKPAYRDNRIGGGPPGSVRGALRSRTPEAFRDVLIDAARTAIRQPLQVASVVAGTSTPPGSWDGRHDGRGRYGRVVPGECRLDRPQASEIDWQAA